MSENAVIARPYAKAIFDIALKDKNLSKWSDILFTLAEIIKDPKIDLFLKDPRIDWQQRAEVFMQNSDQLYKNFIKILALHRRLPYLPDIYKFFAEYKDNYEQMVRVEIISTIKLEGVQKTKLEKALQKKLYFKIIPQYKEDKKLLGGVKIKIGDRIIDDSLQNKLARLRKSLWH